MAEVVEDGKILPHLLCKLQSLLQTPKTSTFTHHDVQWRSQWHGQTLDQNTAEIAYIPWNRVVDFIAGESSLKEAPCTFRSHRQKGTPAGSLRAPRINSAMNITRYHCAYGPQDNTQNIVEVTDAMHAKKWYAGPAKKRGRKPRVRPESKGQKPKQVRTTNNKTGEGMKRGCMCRFVVKQCYMDPAMAEIVYHEKQHVNGRGEICHGPSCQLNRSTMAPHLSDDMKSWILHNLRLGLSINKIMAKHTMRVKELMEQGLDVNRDTFLLSQNIRNIAMLCDEETFRKHPNDAQSVRMWVHENMASVFYYQEEKNHKAWTSSDIKLDLPFVLGIQTVWQRDQMLKFGHRRIVACDATFGTNEKKYPLYTMMVFNQWLNGIPVAFIITARSKAIDLEPWMFALNGKLRGDQAGWCPHAFIVDDADAEIKAIRLAWCGFYDPNNAGDAMMSNTLVLRSRFLEDPNEEWGPWSLGMDPDKEQESFHLLTIFQWVEGSWDVKKLVDPVPNPIYRLLRRTISHTCLMSGPGDLCMTVNGDTMSVHFASEVGGELNSSSILLRVFLENWETDHFHHVVRTSQWNVQLSSWKMKSKVHEVDVPEYDWTCIDWFAE